MRKLVIILCAIFASLNAHAQPSGAWPTGIVNVNDGWRVRAGDDPAYATPNFDDSSWTQVTFTEDFVLAGPAAAGHSRWMRRRLVLPPSGHVDLLLFADYGSLEVYVDGQRVGPAIAPSYTWARANELIYPLRTTASPIPSTVEIAIRSHAWYAQQTRRLTPRGAVIGDPGTIAKLAAAHSGNRLGTSVFSASVNLAALLLSVVLLAIYLRQRSYREYLWLGLTVAAVAAYQGLAYSTINGHVPLAVDAIFGNPSGFLFMAAELAFVYSFIGRRPPLAIRAYQVVLLVAPSIVTPVSWLGLVPVSTELFFATVLVFPGTLLVAALLVNWYRQGSRDAGILFIPVLLLNLASIVRNIDLLIRFARPGFALPIFHLGLLRLQYDPVAQLLFLLTISIVIVLRFLDANREQARIRAELASARTIQQFLVPQALPDIPGFHVESVYLPAQQVGGDFFQLIALPAGGALVIMGDVSGKGLPAAMNVAMIVGALRTLVETTDSPAAILAGLNRRLRGRPSGFTTCIALSILGNGATTLANAGHLNPYLSGRELPTESGLPLGLDIDLDTAYPETALTLAPGDTLTLVTDGVVEATNPETKELFGFDRTAAISSKHALEIAATAQAFGQEDDIAVLTLTFKP